MTAANAMLGNDPDAAVLTEVCLGGPSLKALSGTVRISLAGELTAQVVNTRGRVLKVLRGRPPRCSPAMSCASAAWHAVSPVSASPAASRCRCNWVAGRPIRGQESVASRAGRWQAAIACNAIRKPGIRGSETCGTLPWPVEPGRSGCSPDRRDDHFTPEALGCLSRHPYRVTRDMDRMGIRLDGEKLTHNDRGRKLSGWRARLDPGSGQWPAHRSDGRLPDLWRLSQDRDCHPR